MAVGSSGRLPQRPGFAEAARWGMTESAIACLVLSRTDKAAAAEMAAPAMMYIAGTLGWPVSSINQVATAGAVPPATPTVML